MSLQEKKSFLGIEMTVTVQWLAFATLAIVSMFTLRRHIYSKLMAKPLGKVSGDVDQKILVTQDLAPGNSCRIEYRGTGWTALNVGERSIAAGATARIESVDGLTLKVRAS
jgi:membrane protein implicated in regulation of membrane protease activity